MALTQISTKGIKDGTITGTDLATNIDLVDNQKLRIGTGNDLQISHDGSHSKVLNTTGNLFIGSNASVDIGDGGYSEYSARFTKDGAASLYYDGSKKFETTSSGVNVTGMIETTENIDIDADNQPLRVGSSQNFQFVFTGSEGIIKNIGATSPIKIKVKDGVEDSIVCNANGAVELYHDNSKKFETTSTGAKVTGRLGVNLSPATAVEVQLDTFAATGNDDASDWGAGGIFQLLHNGTAAVNNEVLLLGAVSGAVGQIACGFGFGRESTTNWGTYISFKTHSTSTVNIDELIERWKITSDGHFENNSDSIRIKLGASDDLQIYHDGSNSYVNNTGTGLLILQGNGSQAVSIRPVSGETGIAVEPNGAAKLYHDNTKKFETTSAGVTVTGTINFGSGMGSGLNSNGFNINFADSNGSQDMAKFGTGGDLRIYHDSANSYIQNITGALRVYNHVLDVRNDAGNETILKGSANGAVELYYNGSKTFETRSDGVNLYGKIVQTSTSARALQLNRNGSAGQMMLFDFQGTKCGEILVDTNSTSYITNGSDRSLKKNFQSWNENVLNLFKNINPQEFHFNNQQDTDKKQKGYVAQDMVDSFPEAYPKDDDGKYAFNPSGMVVYLMKAIQELEAEVAALKAA